MVRGRYKDKDEGVRKCINDPNSRYLHQVSSRGINHGNQLNIGRVEETKAISIVIRQTRIPWKCGCVSN